MFLNTSRALGWLVLCAGVLMALGCDDDPSESTSSNVDGAFAADSASNADLGPDRTDGQPVRPDGTVLDAALDLSLPADSALDMAHLRDSTPGQDAVVSPVDQGQSASDAGGDPFQGRPTGQCTENADCPDGLNGTMCSLALPGGACLGCGGDDDCPGVIECVFGNCVAACDTNDDCAPGLTCSGRGRCGAMPCVDGQCPVAFLTCNDSDRCSRQTCADQGDCPAQTTCQGGYCIENRAL
mgnify:FL=1